ncbi:MAG TPA: flavoprotein, partial [Patescibacteria group bacterium]|nr:flavoprotein [Patescibacteria group bacterium]
DKRLEAEIVMDASGVYDTPAFAGTGGLPARGEIAAGTRMLHHLGAIDQARDRLRGRRLLLVGHGHSAANALLMLEAVAVETPGTRVTWATRSANRRPVAEAADDPLPERQRVASRANALAAGPPNWLTVARRASIDGLEPEGAGGGALRVTLSTGGVLVVDEIIALTGYRPDLGFLSELALEISPATEGAARLARALSGVTDCLAVPEVGPRDLDSGEPGFYLIGSKSYGRSRTFLIRTGLAQVERILEEIR